VLRIDPNFDTNGDTGFELSYSDKRLMAIYNQEQDENQKKQENQEKSAMINNI